MSVSPITLHAVLASASDPTSRIWVYAVRELAAGQWLAVAELTRAAGQVGPALRLTGRGATQAAAVVDLAAVVDRFEALREDAAELGGAL